MCIHVQKIGSSIDPTELHDFLTKEYTQRNQLQSILFVDNMNAALSSLQSFSIGNSFPPTFSFLPSFFHLPLLHNLHVSFNCNVFTTTTTACLYCFSSRCYLASGPHLPNPHRHRNLHRPFRPCGQTFPLSWKEEGASS